MNVSTSHHHPSDVASGALTMLVTSITAAQTMTWKIQTACEWVTGNSIQVILYILCVHHQPISPFVCGGPEPDVTADEY